MTTHKMIRSKATLKKAAAKRKNASKKNNRGILQSSPITIGGGGSVKLKFDQGRYLPGAAGGFINADDELITLLIVDEHLDLVDNLHHYVEQRKCTVNIVCRYRGVESTIRIDSTPGGPLVIDFEQHRFPYDNGRGHWYSGNLKIREVTVFDHVTNAQSPPANVPQNGKCGIFAINRL